LFKRCCGPHQGNMKGNEKRGGGGKEKGLGHEGGGGVALFGGGTREIKLLKGEGNLIDKPGF